MTYITCSGVIELKGRGLDIVTYITGSGVIELKGRG